MSLKKVVLIVALVLLATPAAALADGLTFGFTSGGLFVDRSSGTFHVGTAANSTGTVVLTYVSKMLGSSPFGPATTPTFGTAPVTSLPGTPILNNFGSVTFTTGLLTGSTGLTSATFAAGGSIVITSGGTFGTDTGGAITNGTTLFSGAFSGPTTLTQIFGGSGSNCNVSFHFCYSLTGPISGTLDPSVLSFFGLGSNSTVSGQWITLIVGFNDTTTSDSTGALEGGAASVVATPIPEPGTLALFGTGLVGLAAFVRRRTFLKRGFRI